MANPALKDGHFSIANELAEEFAKVNITGQQWRIIWVLWRKTWGWKHNNRRKDWDWISITQFEKLTGMKRANVYNTLKTLLAKRLILKQENLYKFNQNYNEWVLAKRLTVLANRLTPISQKANRTVSQLTTHKRKKETITKETLSAKADEVNFSFKEKVQLMLDSKKDKRMPIIASYWLIKGFNFDNLEQYRANLSRELKISKNLESYNLEQIVKCMHFLKEKVDYKWTLESVFKSINDYITANQ